MRINHRISSPARPFTIAFQIITLVERRSDQYLGCMVARMMIERNSFIVVKEDCLFDSCVVFIWDLPEWIELRRKFWPAFEVHYSPFRRPRQRITPPSNDWIKILLNYKPLTGIPLLAHICATFINELRASLITFLLFVPWQRLIARNLAELFSSNRGISHLNETCRVDELSRGSVLGLKFSQTTNDRNVP